MKDAAHFRLRLALLLGALALAAFACLSRDVWNMPLRLDNQHYYFIAERAASGVPPHVSHFDPKHSLAMLISGAAIRVGRVLGENDVHAARIASIAAAVGAVAAASMLALHLFRSSLAAGLAALAMLSSDGFLSMAAMGARPKVFLPLPLLLAALAVARGRPFWVGVSGAVAFLCWQPTLLALVAAAAVILLLPGALRGLGRLALGASIPVLLYHLYYLAHGALGEQIQQAYRFPALYMTHASVDLERHLRGVFLRGGGFSQESVLLLFFAAILLGVWGLACAHPARFRSWPREHPGLTYLGLSASAALVFTLYDFQSYVDAFFVLPYAAVAGAGVVAGAVERLGRAWPVAARRGIALVAFLGLLSVSTLRPARAELGMRLSDQERLATRVGTYLAAGRSVYAVGCTHLLAFNHVDNHVRYGFFFRGMDGYLSDLAPGPLGYRPLRDGRMPDIILVSRPFIPGGTGWLEAEYENVTPPAFRRQGIRVWQRHPGLSVEGIPQ